MSGPNTNYDPVQVSALDADQVEARVAEALEAIARASTCLLYTSDAADE